MQLREDAYQVTVVAFGPEGTRADELLAGISGLAALRPAVESAGWTRREFGLKLEAGAGSAKLGVTLVAYGKHAESSALVPPVDLADAVLFFCSGDAARDATTRGVLDGALALRIESPARIAVDVQRAAQTREAIAEHLKTVMTLVIEALAEDKLVDYWAASARREAESFHAALYGALGTERIMQVPPEELLGLLLQIAYERASRATREGHVASLAEYYARLDLRWRELIALNVVEVQTGGAGLGSLFGDRGNRAVEPLDLASAIDLYMRIGAREKATVLREALVIAERERLWDDHRNDFFESAGWHELATLTRRFNVAPPVFDAVTALIRTAPDRFTLPAYDDEWHGAQA